MRAPARPADGDAATQPPERLADPRISQRGDPAGTGGRTGGREGTDCRGEEDFRQVPGDERAAELRIVHLGPQTFQHPLDRRSRG